MSDDTLHEASGPLEAAAKARFEAQPGMGGMWSELVPDAISATVTTPPDALREALDEIVVRALAAQQAFADWHSEPVKYEASPPEPKSEDIVRDIIDAIAPALAEARTSSTLTHEEMDALPSGVRHKVLRMEYELGEQERKNAEARREERERCAEKAAELIRDWFHAKSPETGARVRMAAHNIAVALRALRDPGT